MFFAQEYINFSIVDVFRIEQDINRKFVHSPRSYSSISLRYDAEASIVCYGETHDVSNTVSYFPAQMPYTRLAKRDNLIVIHLENHSHVSSQLESFLPANPQAYRALFEQSGTALGLGIAALQQLLDVERIVIGGSVSASMDLIRPALVKTAQSASYWADNPDEWLYLATLQPDSGLYGAACLAADHYPIG